MADIEVIQSGSDPGQALRLNAAQPDPGVLTPIFCLLPSALTVLWLVTRARWFWNHNPDLRFGWLVLLMSGYLFYEAWERRPVLQLMWRRTGVALTLTGLGGLFYTQLYQAAYGLTTEGMSALGVSALMFIAGNLHYVFGREGITRFAFAFGFLFLALPIPDTIYFPLISGLQSAVASATVALLNLAGIPAEQIGNAIRLSACVVGIDEACSGIRSLQSTVLATVFIGYLTLRKRSLQAVLFGLGILLAMGGNLLRCFWLSYAAHARGPAAIDSFHDVAGWSILAFTAGGVAAAAWGLSRWERTLANPPSERPADEPS